MSDAVAPTPTPSTPEAPAAPQGMPKLEGYSELSVDAAADALFANVDSIMDVASDEAANPPRPRDPDAQPKERKRGEDGKFEAEQKADAAEEATEQAEAPEAEKADAETDEDIVEIAIGEGQEPIKAPLSKLVELAAEAVKLKEDMAKGALNGPLPTEVQSLIQDTVKVRSEYMAALETWKAQNTPRAPSLDMIDPNSPNYDPGEFKVQLDRFQAARTQLAQAEAERKHLAERNEKDQALLRQSLHATHRANLLRDWPELADTKAALEAQSELQRLYAIDGETLSEVLDPRFYRLAKDALAYHKLKRAEATTAKVVKAKPKLIKGGARQTVTAKRGSVDSALERLSKTGSIDDAAALIENLL